MSFTEEQYAKQELGMKCPNCESTEIQSVDLEFCGTAEVLGNVACDDCGAYWIEIYQLHSFAQLTLPTEQEAAENQAYKLDMRWKTITP